MSKELKIVRCKSCDWVGDESKLIKKFNASEFGKLEHCPKCDDEWNLVDIGFSVRREG